MDGKKLLIVWEKWVDPFGGDIDEAKWTDYESNFPENYIDDEDGEDYENTETQELKNSLFYNKNKQIKVIASPLGFIPYNEHTASSKIFNFWLGHTNFNISESVKNVIESCEGVEILDVFTRYRFRIAVGKCFNDADTMCLINDKICNTFEQTNDNQ